MQPAHVLLGRKTLENFAAYWPECVNFWPGINEVTKYSLSKIMNKSDWNNSVFLESLSDIENLRKSEGSEIKVWGNGELLQLLFKII
ncbi:hypothetical protein ACFSNA_03200 [Pedobacter mendelii]|uniref:Uncharacterized protein n=1 Tax=Pedobacter mendelii TaxID=1908240 RepID=A0ABQ2BBG2_9SPHI|nr:hypothetical protein GCM10008119_01720 [Pedobacter mendelii]